MGVITYFLLCGYTPFDRDTQQQEMEAIIAVSVTLVTVYYMAKAVDKSMVIGEILLAEKLGGRSGHWSRT